ncbi:MAG: hypothetical protein ACJ74F_21580 [Mycobacterium sp.]|uniref:hypothetical protein n=1 Tax=Mycobacterium sp. TaxID=1785 RepID=UPI00389A2936
MRDDPGGDTLSNPTYYKGTATTPAPGGVDRTSLGCVDAANAPAICTYDKNKDSRVWVRVDVNVRGKTRSLVALLQLEKFNLPLTAAAVVGNRVKMTNGGNNAVVNTNGSTIITRCTPSPRATTTQPLSPGALTVTVDSGAGFSSITGKQVAIDTGLNWEVADLASVSGNTLTFATNGQRHGPQKAHASGVRIEFAPKQGSGGNPCAGWDPAQITPPQSYVSIPGYQDGLTPSALAGMLKTATAVYPDTAGNPCPSNANSGIAWYGQIVIKGPADCVMNPNNGGGGPANINPTTPGAVVVLNGTLSIQGNTNYNGVIYMVNGQDSPNTILTLASTVTVKGGVIVDGDGSIDLGQGTNTVVFDPDAFHHFQAGGAAGLVQNSWRELSAGQ